MNKYQRVTAALLAVCTSATLFAGCGSKSNDGGQGKLIIGGIGPTSGPAADYGQAVRNGAELAVKEINQAGGIGGMQIEFLWEDDAHNPETAVNAYYALMDKGMQVLMGTVTSNPCIAVSEKSKEDNVFMLTPSGSAVDCVKYDNAFRVCFNDPNQGSASAQYIADNLKMKKVAVMYNKSDVYSTGIYETFAKGAQDKKMEIVATTAFTDSSKTDFNVQLQQIKDSGAQLVFLPGYYEEAALILTQAKAAGLTTKFFGCDGLDGVIGQLGEGFDVAEGVMLLTPFAADATDDKTVKFVSAYRAQFGEKATPTQFAADAYDAIYTIKAACEKAGVKNSDISASDLCDKLKTAMTQISVDGVTGTMTWTADGEPTKPAKAMVIKNKAYAAL